MSKREMRLLSACRSENGAGVPLLMLYSSSYSFMSWIASFQIAGKCIPFSMLRRIPSRETRLHIFLKIRGLASTTPQGEDWRLVSAPVVRERVHQGGRERAVWSDRRLPRLGQLDIWQAIVERKIQLVEAPDDVEPPLAPQARDWEREHSAREYEKCNKDPVSREHVICDFWHILWIITLF